MIINRNGAEFEYKGVSFVIGQPVVGTSQSEYEGLYGLITEIRDGEDKETENDTPDIYCAFGPPVLPHDIEELEKRFSGLYQNPKKLEDISLDEVIMAPEMVKVVEDPEKCRRFLPVYIVVEDWARAWERGHEEQPYTELSDAKYVFYTKLKKELEEGCLAYMRGKDNFCVESIKDGYEGFIDGEYDKNHYLIQIEERRLAVSEEFIKRVSVS
jgi:hypothetical protein